MYESALMSHEWREIIPIQAILKDIALRGEQGAVLIFLPGWNEIMALHNLLTNHQEFCKKNDAALS